MRGRSVVTLGLAVLALLGGVVIASPAGAAGCPPGQYATAVNGVWQMCVAARSIVPRADDGGSPAPAAHPAAGGGASCRYSTYNPIDSQNVVNDPSRGGQQGGLVGQWMYETCTGASSPGWVFIPGKGVAQAGPAAPAVVAPPPATLAQQAYAQLAPPALPLDYRPRHHPGGADSSLVGVRTYAWIDPSALAPLRRSAAVAGNWATVTATVSSLAIDPGDGSAPFTCPGGGQPYNPNLAANRQPSTCWHVYIRPTTSGPFPLRVTAPWSATWTGSGGAGGTLPALTATAAVPITVNEMQVVTTN